MSLTGDGLAHVDKLHWHAQHEGHDLQEQVEAYKARYGYYPEVVMGDMAYGSQNNRSFLKKRHIRFSGQPLGKYGYRLNNIRARRADTSVAWINSIFLVMNLLVLMRVFVYLKKFIAKMAIWATKNYMPGKIPFAHSYQLTSKWNFCLVAQTLGAEFLSRFEITSSLAS